MVAAEMSATSPSAISCRASSAQSHWERLRPNRSGRSQAKRTTWMATAGGKTALGTAARSVSQAIQPLGQKPSGPFTYDGPLDANSLSHVGVRVPSRQEKNDLSPAHPSGTEGG